MFLILPVVLILLTTFLIGMLVLLRAAGTRMHNSFVILAFSVTLWMLANFIGSNFKNSSFALIASRLDFVSGTWLAYSAWIFAASLMILADSGHHFRWLYRKFAYTFVGIFASMAAIASFVPEVIEVKKLPGFSLEIDYGKWYVIYAVALVAVVALVVAYLFIALRVARGRLRAQISVMFASLLVGMLTISFANLILPNISSSSVINLVGGDLSYVGIAVFLLGTSYSIIRQRLFDLRLVLARSLAYLLLFAVLSSAYVVMTVLVSNALIPNYKFASSSLVVPIFSLILLTFTAQPLAKFFNKLTNRLFYHDSYEAQDVLDKLGKLLTYSVNAKNIQDQTKIIINEALHPVSVSFVLVEHDEYDRDFIDHLRATKLDIIAVDELDHLSDAAVVSGLNNNNTALAVRLHTSHEDIGYLLLGYRKSGANYSSSDRRLLVILAEQLAVGLQNALRFEEIQRFNLTLQEEVETATRKLKKQNKRLEELDDIKDDFISMASHQLRTPLTTAKGYLSMVLEGDVGKLTTQQTEMLQQAYASAQRMVFLITDLLNVSRLKTGKFIMNPTPTDLSEVITEEVAQLQETAQSKGVTLTFDRPAQFPKLELDEVKIRQVIMNFADNAIYYTPAGGHIRVELEDKPSSIELRVVDDGIGVPKAEQHHLFTKFYRATNARKARPDGTGLGLFMAEKVIVASGGTIIFKSKEDEGSTFGFMISKNRLKAKAYDLAVAADKP